MKILVGDEQDAYWQRTRYRGPGDPLTEAFASPKLDYISQFIDLRGTRIVDVGCGNGIFSSRFARLARQIVGVDYSAFMLAHNPERCRVRARAEALPFASGSFDVAFESNLLHHVEQPETVIQELARLSRRYVVLLEPNRWNPLMFGFGLLVKAERGTLRMSRAYVEQLLSGAGLRIIRCSAMGMISQNNTPPALVPFLGRFDREIAWGEYLVAIAEKDDGRREASAGRSMEFGS